MQSIKTALQFGYDLLQSGESESPHLDAELLLCSILGKSREHLFTWPERELNAQQQNLFQRQCQRRAKGYPVAYLIGRRDFWDLTISVNAAVLIPRPETELLVELVLEYIENETAVVVDLGTGSGAIALALASEHADWTIIAGDISDAALQVAKDNSQQLKLQNIDFRLGKWCEVIIEQQVDAIVANPPYIDQHDVHLSQGDVRFEPELALVSAEHGLADIIEIANQARDKLKPNGWLLLEHGYQQGQQVSAILQALTYSKVETFKDLAGNDRVTIGCNSTV